MRYKSPASLHHDSEIIRSTSINTKQTIKNLILHVSHVIPFYIHLPNPFLTINAASIIKISSDPPKAPAKNLEGCHSQVLWHDLWDNPTPSSPSAGLLRPDLLRLDRHTLILAHQWLSHSLGGRIGSLMRKELQSDPEKIHGTMWYLGKAAWMCVCMWYGLIFFPSSRANLQLKFQVDQAWWNEAQSFEKWRCHPSLR